MASQWLSRPGVLPLHVEMYWPMERDDDHPDDEMIMFLQSELADLVKRCAWRCRTLSLNYIPDDRIVDLFVCNELFSTLERLRILPDELYGISWMAGKCPILDLSGCTPSSLELGFIHFRLIRIEWNKLTRLTFFFCDGLGLDQLISILQNAPCLEFCRALGAHRVRAVEGPVPTPRSDPIVHSNLETFLLYFKENSDWQFVENFLRRTSFPSLRTLCFGREDYVINLSNSLFDVFVSFTSKSASSLTTLCLEGLKLNGIEDDAIRLLQSMPNLQSLCVANWSRFITNDFFERLAKGDGPGDDNQQVEPFLPSLRKFNFVGSRFFSWTSFERILWRVGNPPQNFAILCECNIYLWDQLGMDEAIEERLDTMKAVKVRRIRYSSDYGDAMKSLGVRMEEKSGIYET